MKSLLLAGAISIAAANVAFAQGYWVIGNRATGKCEIVTSNPVITGPVGGDVTFGTKDDAPSWRARRSANARLNRPSRSRTKPRIDA